MEVSERELEDICIAVMHYMDLESDMANRMFKEFAETGGITFHVVPKQE